MWVFTKHGFFSAVCARQGDGREGQPVDASRMMVRARVREHLEALKRTYPDLAGQCRVEESKGTDYAFRVFLPKSAWSELLARLAEDTDYDNFKSAVARHQGPAGAPYEHCLLDVWQTMRRLQRL